MVEHLFLRFLGMKRLAAMREHKWAGLVTASLLLSGTAYKYVRRCELGYL